MKVIKAVSDYVLVLKDGKVIEEGESEEIFNFAKQKYTNKLLQSFI